MSPLYYASIFYAFSAIQHSAWPDPLIHHRLPQNQPVLLASFFHIWLWTLINFMYLYDTCFLFWYPQKCRIVVLCTQLITHLNIKISISLSTAFPDPALLGPWSHADYCDRSWKVFRTKIDRVITFIYEKVMFKTHMVDIFSTQIYAIKQNKHTTFTWQLQVHHMCMLFFSIKSKYTKKQKIHTPCTP